MHSDGRQKGLLKRLLVVVGTVLWTDGCLGYSLAPAFLFSSLDKVTVSAVNFLSSKLLEKSCEGDSGWEVNFSFLFIKTSGVLKLYSQMT